MNPLRPYAAAALADVDADTDALLGPSPNSFSPPPPPPRRLSLYHPSLRPLLSCRSLRSLLQAHGHLLAAGLLRDSFAAFRLLKAAAATAEVPLSYTLLLFRNIPAPDAFCVNTVLKTLAFSSRPLLALRFFSANLPAGFVPNSFTFPVLFAACARAASLDAGEMCHGQAVKRGVDNELHVGNSLIHMYGSCGLIGCARMLFDEMHYRDIVSWNSIVDGYATLGDLVGARELFDQMPNRNVVSWNVMTSGYIKWRRPELGLEICRQMEVDGFKATDKTMTNVLTACGRLGGLNGGKSAHAYFLRNFVEDNLIIGTALVDMYSRCGMVDVARRIFDGMADRNLISWNAMIIGHCIHGLPEDGLALFHEMIDSGQSHNCGNLKRKSKGVSPDEVTFVGVLCACARKGLLTEGKKYFEQMTVLYNMTPTFAHYWCMANLYGGLGLVQEAEEVLGSMPEETESLALGYLLGLCRFRGELELGENIAKRLIDLEPQNGSRYALLHNIYAAAGRWEDAQELKEMMKKKGIRFLPGHRLVDLNEIVHKFRVGDRSCSEIEKVFVMLDDMTAKMRIRGVASNMVDFCPL